MKSNAVCSFAAEMSVGKRVSADSLRRTISFLISGRTRVGGGWKLVEGQKLPSRLKWTRYCNNRHIRALIKQGLMSEDFQLINPLSSDVGISYNKLKELFKL